MDWKQLTRRTDQPKLGWLMRALQEAGIQPRLNGESFHGPIMEVPASEFDKAWRVLGAVDDLADDDPMFLDPARAWPWWIQSEVRRHGVPNMLAGIGVWANKLRRAITHGTPDPELLRDSPMAYELMRVCPADLASLCLPMVRVEVYAIAVATQMQFSEAGALSRAQELIKAAAMLCGEQPHPVTPVRLMITHMHVLGRYMTEGRFGARILRFVRRPPIEFLRDLMQETRWHEGKLYPRWIELSVGDLADSAAGPLN